MHEPWLTGLPGKTTLGSMKNPFMFRPSASHVAKSESSRAMSSVQTSLFSRLGKSYPHTRGKVAWVLVWAGMPSNKHHAESLACLASVSPEELAGLRETVESCAQAQGREDDQAWQSLCAQILSRLSPSSQPSPLASQAALRAVPDGSDSLERARQRARVASFPACTVCGLGAGGTSHMRGCWPGREDGLPDPGYDKKSVTPE